MDQAKIWICLHLKEMTLQSSFLEAHREISANLGIQAWQITLCNIGYLSSPVTAISKCNLPLSVFSESIFLVSFRASTSILVHLFLCFSINEHDLLHYTIRLLSR